MHYEHVTRAAVLAVAGSILAAGCGGEKIDRVEVSGTITLDEKPLKSGAISFVPLEGGPTAGTTFTDGQYRIAREQGPGPGPYRVEIVAYRGTGEMVPDSDFPGEMVEQKEQVVPARYNSESELSVELTAGEPNRHDFPLESQ